MEITFSETGMLLERAPIDVFELHAMAQIEAVLGKAPRTFHVGVAGTGRTGHAFVGGIIAVSQRLETDLVEILLPFQVDDGVPWTSAPTELHNFTGVARIGSHTFRGGELERDVLGVPGVSGIAGDLSLKLGELRVSFTMTKSRNRFGKRTGARRLVAMSASWGGVRPFPPPM
jgi:hypothetical protein